MSFVLDASVYIARHSPKEAHHERAKELWHLAAVTPFQVPEIFALEIVAAYSRLQIDPETLSEHRALTTSVKFVAYPLDKALIEEAIVVARDGRTRAADAIYVALALRLQATFLTLDMKLKTSLATSTNAALRDLKILS